MSFSLKEPRLVGVPVGSPAYFQIQRDLIAERPLLKSCYDTWYRELISANQGRPFQPGETLELGSGGSLLRQVVPGLITSDVVEGLADRVVDGRELPFPDGSLQAIFMTHTMHHIPDVKRFFAEADRALRPGGFVAMVEVAHTPFAKFFFTHFHPEPYDDRTVHWDFTQQDSMMDSNQALSWLVFVRDRRKYEAQFPKLRIERFGWLPWFTYLAAGGVTMRNIVPGPLVPPLRALEWLLTPLRPLFALHWLIILRKLP
ncbi:MAG: class I SAM-dependent methyltransferase [Acidobacteria bacterium]|nr:class I SAM-dependent methyltransferase [Acidobacteriota bacterium]